MPYHHIKISFWDFARWNKAVFGSHDAEQRGTGISAFISNRYPKHSVFIYLG
ncbi:MAG: hypothetical protein K8R46_05795 [Pirellulales bacterium]|nr:hypothetical protein [Pirellulales bacterium]